ncbi:MAG TPA: MBL fold metallo-hydrolase [Candidatus Polarisedimenticolaceae bacterium]|nr:MBL fold metallo-hydrolase [Candidatus Polarisedimenticolaceae bacterium]
MRSVFHPFLPNGPAGDPVLWVDLPDEGHSLMLDLGRLDAITPRKLLRVGRVVVSHTHIDHFIGFDALLRLVLGRERELVLSGPDGFLERVAGKIHGYSWNLIERYPVVLVAEEVAGGVVRSVRYTGANRMRGEPPVERPVTGALHAHRAYTVHVDSFDHGIPVLGVALRETEHLSVNRDRLQRLGLEPGEWLGTLKNAVRRGVSADREIAATTSDGGTRSLRVGRLEDEILLRTRGQTIGYLTDLAHTQANLDRAARLLRDVDLLVCEAAFLDADRDLACERRHLTARQAGELARACGARKLAPFHFSPRYAGRHDRLRAEAAEAFGGPVVSLPTGP